MKKCCFIIPYFGKLPRHFDVFLKSCEYNIDFYWIIFTDDRTIESRILPKNVKYFKMTFEECQNLIKSKFDFEILLKEPYKLCDYKPAYGYIFEKYIEDFEFWGHCDIDTIMGNLKQYITNDILEKYDKIFCLGHMILYRNSFENNRVFMRKYKNVELYKKVFSNNEIMWFDECFKDDQNINSIFLNEGKMVYTKDLSLNFKMFPTNFVKTTYNFEKNVFEDQFYEYCLPIFDNGHIYLYYKSGEKLVREEFLYAHFQSRNMRVHHKLNNYSFFKILPNVFMPLEVNEITNENYMKIKKKRISFHYIERQLIGKLRRIKKIIKRR